MDFSTDSRGRILSMNYVETGGYSGELFAVFGNFGNIDEWITKDGLAKRATIYDLNNEFKIELWNPPPGLDVPFGWNGKNGDITIQVGTDKDLIINSGGSNFSITNPWRATDDLGWAKPPKTTKGGGDDDICSSDCKVGEKLWPCGGTGLSGLFHSGKIALVEYYISLHYPSEIPDIMSDPLGIIICGGVTVVELTEVGKSFLSSFGVTDEKVQRRFNDFLDDVFLNGRNFINCEVIVYSDDTCSLRCTSSGGGNSVSEEFC